MKTEAEGWVLNPGKLATYWQIDIEKYNRKMKIYKLENILEKEGSVA